MTASNVTQNQNLNNAEAIQIDEAMEIIPAQPINDMNQVNIIFSYSKIYKEEKQNSQFISSFR